MVCPPLSIMAIRLPSLRSITPVIVLLALCPVLAVSPASPPILTANAKSNSNAPSIDGDGLGGSSDLPQHPFLAPLTPEVGARNMAATPPGVAMEDSPGGSNDPTSSRVPEEGDRNPFHAGPERDRGFRVKVVDGYGPDSERTSTSSQAGATGRLLHLNNDRSSVGFTETINNRANFASATDEEDATESESVIRGIMENFADDFESPPDSQLSEDVFNREPYYYDVYYDTFENNNVAPESSLSEGDNRLPSEADEPYLTAPAGDEPADSYAGSLDLGTGEEDLTSVQEALDLRLLGADLQSELGFVLQQLTNGSQRNRRHQVPVRHHDTRPSHGINVGMQVGACPPPVHSLPPGLCGAPPCTSHMMCYPQKMCCFNGCTYTCTEPVRPPPVIDWLEDTGSLVPLLDPLNPALPLRFESSPLSYGTGGGETVRLPGGCTLSAAKYEELKQFMTAESIQDCMCSGGEVVCVVKSAPAE